jgi:hypothetical protein
MKPKSGERFKKLVGELSKKPGVTDPAALAAKIGREKYGKATFQRMSVAGKRAKASK